MLLNTENVTFYILINTVCLSNRDYKPPPNSPSLRWSGPALSPYREQSPNSRVFVSRFFLAEGGSEMRRFACATGANAKDGVSGVRKAERDKT